MRVDHRQASIGEDGLLATEPLRQLPFEDAAVRETTRAIAFGECVMERFRRVMSGRLSPKQTDTLQKVLASIIKQPWFDNSERSCNILAERLAILIKMGIEDAAHLQTIGVSWAVSDFIRHGAKMDRAHLRNAAHGIERLSING